MSTLVSVKGSPFLRRGWRNERLEQDAGLNKKHIPRVVIAGVSSGSGKTSITMGVLKALRDSGIRAVPYKVGPDYIDPGHLSAAAGIPCRNLDPILMGESGMTSSLAANTSEGSLAVIEGVMGLYDGKGDTSSEGSSADIAKRLKAPVIVVLDASASAQTVGAVALGMKLYDPDLPLAGFIVNKIGSPRHFKMVRKAVEDAAGLPVFGYMPKQREVKLPERHLGLVAAWEEASRRELLDSISQLGNEVLQFIDCKAITACAEASPPLEINESVKRGSLMWADLLGQPIRQSKPPLRLGIAWDSAFHFYYEDNLDILRALGAELVRFSPREDACIPDNLDGIYFGGGYPELHAEKLSENTGMISSLRMAAEQTMPIFGECGGLMYLVEALHTDGKRWPMAGLLPGEIKMTGKLSVLGYHTGRTLQDSLIGPAGTSMPGHVYHWSNFISSHATDEWVLELENAAGEFQFDGLSKGSCFASYLHMHFAGAAEPAKALITAMHTYHTEYSL